MSFVHKLAKQRRTVIATIHQPSPDTFALATTVVLLSGGRLCYCGPSPEVTEYFQGLGFAAEGFSNPTDFALSVVGGSLGTRLVHVPGGGDHEDGRADGSGGTGGSLLGSYGGGSRPLTPRELAGRFQASPAFRCITVTGSTSTATKVASVHAVGPGLAPVVDPSAAKRERRQPTSFPTGLGNQCRVLLERSWLTQTRQLGFIRAQIAKNLIVASVCGAVFYGQGAVPPPSDQFNQESFNVSSILFFAMLYTIVGNLQAIPQLFTQRVLYVRERSAFLYSTFAYWLANALVNLPLVLLCHVIFLNVAYLLVQLDRSPSVFFYTQFVTMLNNVVAFTFAQFLAASAPSAQVALAIFPVTFLFLTSFAGFTVPLQDLPSGWIWASYISYPRWCYEGIVASQFSVRIDGASTMEYYGFGGWEPGKSFYILFIFLLLFNGLVYWGLLPRRSRLVDMEDREGEMGEKGEKKGATTCDTKGLRAPLLMDDMCCSSMAVEGGIRDEDEEEGMGQGGRDGLQGAFPLHSSMANVAGGPDGGPLSSPAGPSKGLKQKLLAADDKDLDIPRVLLESLTGTSDTAFIDSRLNSGGARTSNESGRGGHDSFLSQLQQEDREKGGALDVKDFEMRSSNIPRSGGIRLRFRNLTYSLGSRGWHGQRKRVSRAGNVPVATPLAKDATGTKKYLLRKASGRVNPGEMCALMGGSGAGKTTLLDVLAGRKTAGLIEGEVFFNGKAGMPSPKLCSYVTQDNVHIGCFTVRETLHFAALLRIKEGVRPAQREKMVNDVLGMLGLDSVADVMVGDSLRKGISGGQARRLTIGVEIINLPGMIFLDEPTTGLDSNISYEVMAAVRNLANQNRTVCCTIHQPSIEVFALFDKLILMAKGEQVYFGATHEAVKYFSSPALDFAFSKGVNPAEFVMSASSGSILTRGGLKRDVHELSALYRASDLFMQFSDDFDAAVLTAPGGLCPGLNLTYGSALAAEKDLTSAPEMSALENRLFFRDMLQINKILIRRQFLKMRRNRRLVVVGLIRHVLVALFYGSLYWQVAPTAIQSRLSLLFFAIMFVMLGNQQSIPAVYEDRLLYYREKGAHVYGPYSYWMTCAASFIPQIILNTLLYSGIMYPMAGLHSNFACFGYFYLVTMLCSLCALFFCQLLSITLPNPQTAVAVFPASLFIFVLFAGFIVRLPSLPSWIGAWCPDASFARWAFQGLVINELDGNARVSYKDLPAVYYSPNPYQTMVSNLGFQGYSKWFTVPILLSNMVLFRGLTYLSLIFINHESR